MWDSGPIGRMPARAQDRRGNDNRDQQQDGRSEFEYKGPDFSGVTTVDGILQVLAAMKQQGDSLATRSGHEYDPATLAMVFQKGAEALLAESGRQRRKSRNSMNRKVPVDIADSVLAQAGVTSNGGFREAVRLAVDTNGYRMHGSDYSAMNSIAEVGAYHPARVLFEKNREEFVRQYPREWAVQNWSEESDDMSAIREGWNRIFREEEDYRRKMHNRIEANWQEGRKQVSFDDRYVTQPHFPNGRRQYDDYLMQQAQRRADVQRRQQERAAAGHHDEKLISPFAVDSMSRSVAVAFRESVPKGTEYSYTGINDIQTERGVEKVVARTVDIPIQGYEGESITLTVLGDAEQGDPRMQFTGYGYQEAANRGIRGVVLEQVGGLNVHDTRQRLNRDQLQMLLAAGQQLRIVERQLMQQFGVDVGVTQAIAAVLKAHRVER